MIHKLLFVISPIVAILFLFFPYPIRADFQSFNLTVRPSGNQFNLPPIDFSPEPPLPHDIAWKKPAFASTYYEDGYPSKATAGLSQAWRTASSTGTWFYVDLGEPETFTGIATTLFVDSNFSPAPHTLYLASSDLSNWEIIFDEVNPKNEQDRGKVRFLTMSEPATARYVGLYAKDWSGGWADLTQFSVISSQQPTRGQPFSINPYIIFIIVISLISLAPLIISKVHTPTPPPSPLP